MRLDVTDEYLKIALIIFGSGTVSASGVWFNELSSKMELVINEGLVSGKYTTNVSDDGCAKGVFDLAGRADTNEEGVVNLGFVVSWENELSRCQSVTAWSGEYRVENDQERIKTTWILTIETTQRDEWKSTLVGQDVFVRRAPTPEEHQLNAKLKRFSHPT